MEYVSSCPKSYLAHTTPEAFFIHKNMIDAVRKSGNSQSHFRANDETSTRPTYWCYLASPKCYAHSEMLRFVNFLGVQDFKIERFHMDQFMEERGGLVVLRALV